MDFARYQMRYPSGTGWDSVLLYISFPKVNYCFTKVYNHVLHIGALQLFKSVKKLTTRFSIFFHPFILKFTVYKLRFAKMATAEPYITKDRDIRCIPSLLLTNFK